MLSLTMGEVRLSCCSVLLLYISNDEYCDIPPSLRCFNVVIIINVFTKIGTYDKAHVALFRDSNDCTLLYSYSESAVIAGRKPS